MSAVAPAPQGKRAGVAERWISSQAGNTPRSQTNSPKNSNASSPRAPSWTAGSPTSSVAAAAAMEDSSSGAKAAYVSTVGGMLLNAAAATSAGPSAVGLYPSAQLLAYGFSSSSHMALHNAASNAYVHRLLPRLRLLDREAKDGPNDLSSTFQSESFYPSSGNEKLYEAYSDLHSLAQDFRKPFEAPAILVVGHQTDGKSALIEALMGFQFNHVGGGTKTRRPITLHMKYNAACLEPTCFLVTDDIPPREEEQTLEALQAYIESENMRLEREACQFLAKEIIVKIEYKYCPNLTIIDTPGLIAAAPGAKNQHLQAQARAVEILVRSKMQHKEFIILCLEDCSDWTNATTRRTVLQVDPELSRTVIVSTKLDTKIPQFARPADVEIFLRPPTRLLDGNILGDFPFFTSVPSGRVGSSRESVYRSNDHFREAVAAREAQDIASLEEKLDRSLLKEERNHVGVSRLRWFLEHLLQCRYMDSVPSIVPLLDKEYRNASIQLHQTVQELSDLDGLRLKEKGRIFRDSFLAKLSLLLKGTVVAPPDKFGAFVGSDGLQMPYKHMPNAGMRLYGGAQYHRAMAEFRFVVGGMKCPSISREEIVNACGVEDIHDGTNYFRTACVIAVAKARDVFEPFLHQLGFRLSHILRRLLPIALYLLQKDGEYLSGHNMFMKRVSAAFHNFVETTERACREKCMEDLLSTTRYVTWSLHNKSRAGLRQFLDTMSNCEQTTISVQGAVGAITGETPIGNGNKLDSKARQEIKGNVNPALANADALSVSQTAQARLVDLLENTLWNRKLAPSSEEIVNALVARIFEGIRDHFVAAAELKFNCFFLMPVVDKFPALLREDLEVAFDKDIDNVFDVTQARQALEQQKSDLEHELRRVERLQEKFSSIHHQLSSLQPISLPQKDLANEMSSFYFRERH
ncbi:hypothetical protein O6H91_04G126000 [Diphasiastrum complanatum]|uniref:Uncharacterized protein n=1 Tax=Diphasiastrum complanatum TaxID=34168 RepID=A0ACC2E1M1_DIPCM|nr:hypothetical protein O6H91_04G126000 [Diphasiastrum complanatum]